MGWVMDCEGWDYGWDGMGCDGMEVVDDVRRGKGEERGSGSLSRSWRSLIRSCFSEGSISSKAFIEASFGG